LTKWVHAWRENHQMGNDDFDKNRMTVVRSSSVLSNYMEHERYILGIERNYDQAPYSADRAQLRSRAMFCGSSAMYWGDRAHIGSITFNRLGFV
jgi:hypothetical protein